MIFFELFLIAARVPIYNKIKLKNKEKGMKENSRLTFSKIGVKKLRMLKRT